MSGVALLLPGQGSQFVGMGEDLAGAFPSVRELYEEADDILERRLSRLCWDGPVEELTATENAQPAILMHSYAVWTLVREALEDSVVVAAGHSLGEFSAHLSAGTFVFADALRLVQRRGLLMARSGADRPGTMAAILGLSPTQIEELCEAVPTGVVVPANLNAPGQVVISGDVEAVAIAGELASEAGARRVVPLNVSGAFHSPLMEVAAGGLKDALEGTEALDPRFSVIANATAAAVTDAEEARTTLQAQLTSPVRWVESMECMRDEDPERWLELGPGSVLTGLLRRIDRSLSATSVGDAKDVDALLTGA
jgi:[acyl-carrier-protein] S-malonyltransferase